MSDANDNKQSERQAKADPAAVDPMSTWRNLSNTTMDTWAKAMVQFVNTDEYAKSTGAMLNAYMEAAAPQKKIYEQMMARALAQSNMPSREDVLTLAERVTNLEMRLDDIDAKLDLLLARPAHAPAPDSSSRASVKKAAGARKPTSARKRK